MNYRRMAKCVCGSILIWGETETHGDAWIHWRPLPEAVVVDSYHNMVEGSEFEIDENEFGYWNDKTPEELAEYFSSMEKFWRDINHHN